MTTPHELTSELVPRGTENKLRRYVELLLAENARQNLISRSSADDVWSRHILDSAQLARLAPGATSWLDIGSGAGLPGLVLAVITDASVTLCEPRRLRAEFLRYCVEELALAKVSVACGKVETLNGNFDAITARAVGSIDQILTSAMHLAHSGTVWALPKGRSAAKEVAEAGASWQGRFRTVPSLTAAGATIVVATGVVAKAGAGNRR